MSRILIGLVVLELAGVVLAQQPSGISPTPAPGTHMDQSTTQTVGAATGATTTNATPAPEAGTTPSTGSGANIPVANPPQPVTKTYGDGGLADPNDVADVLAPKPLQQSKLSLVGGRVKSIDQVRDHMTVSVYGAGNMQVQFDQRTHFYRAGKETTQMTVKTGDRVYLDTQLFEDKVFARNVHVVTGTSPADANGQIVSFDYRNGNVVVRDPILGGTVTFRINPQTRIRKGDAEAHESALVPGALIAVSFTPQPGKAGTADEVTIIAEPGDSFTYFGRVTHLDLSSGLLAVENQADGKVYDVHLDPSFRIPDNLTIGSHVTVVANFEGKQYTVQRVQVNAGPAEAKTKPDE